MPKPAYTLNDADRAVIGLLRDFIPERVFDAHTHMYLRSAMPLNAGLKSFERDAGTPEDYLADMRPFLPGAREIRLNLMPMPDPAMNLRESGLLAAANGHVRSCLRAHPACVGAAYILSDSTQAEIEAFMDFPGLRAIKCYCYAARSTDYEAVAIADFLPESAWRVANARRLPIFLHMMRPAALADEENRAYIERAARRYPDAQLVLAHCARGFAAWTAIDGLARLARLDNLWFDLSAICEPAPMLACMRFGGTKRVVWGSDYPIPLRRGRAISLGADQHWLCDESYFAAQGLHPAMFIGENLLAFRQACQLADADRTQIEAMFFTNALRLFGPESLPRNRQEESK